MGLHIHVLENIAKIFDQFSLIIISGHFKQEFWELKHVKRRIIHASPVIKWAICWFIWII